ncbi:MAG: hypothetical protein M1436_05420, partial [Acidobacteria bacterium]|nr:hypothetical protein [Acidobacteriota bacterium]
DTTMPDGEVLRRAGEIVERMAACGHPHILGSECDVLHVPEAAETIRRKVQLVFQRNERGEYAS